jgi:hypothetical protein
MNYTYNITLQASDTEVETLVPSKDDLDKVLAILRKIEFIDTTSGKYIPKKAFYDKHTDRVYIGISSDSDTKDVNTDIKSASKPTEHFKLPKSLVNFFIKDAEIDTDSKEVISLREEYFKELADKEAQPGGCSSCKKNQLIRAYANKLLALIQ